jgi:hypothetical protein
MLFRSEGGVKAVFEARREVGGDGSLPSRIVWIGELGPLLRLCSWRWVVVRVPGKGVVSPIAKGSLLGPSRSWEKV